MYDGLFYKVGGEQKFRRLLDKVATVLSVNMNYFRQERLPVNLILKVEMEQGSDVDEWFYTVRAIW